MRATRSIIVGAVAALGLALPASAQISSSAHNFSSASWKSDGNQICSPCHTPHASDTTVTTAPLWNHELTSGFSYDMNDGGGVSTERTLTAGFDNKSILCLSCHDGSNPHLSNLDGFENVQETVAVDTGADIFTLVRVSHIHLFGLTFIFFILGFIFSHAYMRPLWLKVLIVAMPFAGVMVDVIGWYVTKFWTPFAWVVMIAGMINALSFATMWIISMYQMWFYRLPEHVKNRHAINVDELDKVE